MAEILKKVHVNTMEWKEKGGMLKEEEGDITFDLRSLDLSEVTLSHIDMACTPSNHLPRPFQNRSCGVVTHLLLDYNEVQELPNEIGDIEYLQKLSIMGNQLRCLPEGLGKLSKLETLNINENFIQKLSFSLRGLVNLKKLYAVANKISDIESGVFCNMKKLKELYLDENLLRNFPNDLCDLGSLEVLECSDNELSSLPDRFGSLHELATLNLDSNQLTALPRSFSLLRKMKLLLLSNNNIKALPESFPSASTLERLILDKNDLTSIPNWFGDLTNVKELSIDDNELCNDAFTEDFCMAACEMSRFSAGRNYLTKLPANIGNLKNLTWLCLGSTMLELERSNFQSGNWLTSLPDSFTELVNLKKLHLDENQLQLLPEDIGHLNKLEWLDLGQNRLEFLPDSFCELTALSYLQLSKNKLKALPNDIGNLEKLVELRIDSNMLTQIPQSLSKMKSLHSLDLFNNCLTELPKVLVSLGNLKRLDVEQNKFSTHNIPKLVKENVYPERDKSLQDNWRGKTREDKVKCDVIEMPAIDREDEDDSSDEEEFCYNENALREAMRAGMSLWRHHDGPTEREVPSTCTDQDSFTLPNLSVAYPNSKSVTSEESLRYSDCLSNQLDEDWDNELRNELYQDTLDTCNKRKDLNSILIDKFQNNTNRYPPCFHAYSPTACYDSLVYKNAEPSNTEKRTLEYEEGQFDDADF